jgi:hypothetical protein
MEMFKVGDRTVVNETYLPGDSRREGRVGQTGHVSFVVDEEKLFFTPDTAPSDTEWFEGWAVLASELDKMEE